jgi:hypothetical protein
LNRAQQHQVGKASDEKTAVALELSAAMQQFEAACLRGDKLLMEQRTAEVQNAIQRWMDATAGQYEIVRRITYG